MIERFEIINYRGLQNLSLSPLQRVNLVTGPNGVGKTSLAEALWLYHGRYNPPALLWNIHLQRRRIIDPNPLIGLGEGAVELSGVEEDQHCGVRFEFEERMQVLPVGPSEINERPLDAQREGEDGVGLAPISRGSTTEDFAPLPVIGGIRATYKPDPQPRIESLDVVSGPTGPGLVGAARRTQRPSGIIVTRAVPFPIGADTIERFSTVVAQGEKKNLLKNLSVVQPSIKGVEILIERSISSLWADTGGEHPLPVEALGGGIVRLVVLFVNFFAARGGLLVFDEIENGIHHSALPRLWQQVFQMSSLLNVQFVATTHSLECVKAAVGTGENGQAPADFALHQLHQQDSVRKVETYTGDKLMAALDMGFEVR